MKISCCLGPPQLASRLRPPVLASLGAVNRLEQAWGWFVRRSRTGSTFWILEDQISIRHGDRELRDTWRSQAPAVPPVGGNARPFGAAEMR